MKGAFLQKEDPIDFIVLAPNKRGVTTLTNAVSEQSRNCSGNLEISPGIGTFETLSGKHAGHCRKKLGHREISFHVFI